jgi:2,4-dienoyl-CoA reductase-like NADH-dependent reductase (Old Yellow Enzyme family)
MRNPIAVEENHEAIIHESRHHRRRPPWRCAPRGGSRRRSGALPRSGDIRALWKQPLIVNRPARPRDRIGADVASGLADPEAYGQLVLANPVARVKTDAPMNEADRASFLGGAAPGYTDYPALEAATAA